MSPRWIRKFKKMVNLVNSNDFNKLTFRELYLFDTLLEILINKRDGIETGSCPPHCIHCAK